MRVWLVAFCAVTALSGCGSGGTESVQARFEVHAEVIDFGTGRVGLRRTAGVTVRNLGRGDERFELRTTGPFEAPHSVNVPAGGSIDVAISFLAASTGASEGVLTVAADSGAEVREVRLLAFAVGEDDCAPTEDPCHVAAVRDDGTCEVRARPDGEPCDSACLDDGRCQAGACVGHARSCDDGIDCTLDVCAPDEGCLNIPDDSACGENSTCATHSCSPVAGCLETHAPDGTECGWEDCSGTSVCLSGTCQRVERQDWQLEPRCAVSCMAGCRYKSFSVGINHMCGVKQDGTVWCAGLNDYGQLGDASFTGGASAVPLEVKGLPPAREVLAAGPSTCALTEASEVFCWGRNAELLSGWTDCLATGSQDESVRVPRKVDGLSQVRQIAGSSWSMCALRIDGTVWCWGANQYGAAFGSGNGQGVEWTATRCETAPRMVPGVEDSVSISVASRHGCSLNSSGTSTCWGVRVLSGIPKPGGGVWEGAALPPRIVEGVPAFARLAQVASGARMGALSKEGALWSWTTHQSDVPLLFSPSQVPQMSGLVALVLGQRHGCGLQRDGSVYCWGENTAAQLGNGHKDTFSGHHHPPQRVNVPRVLWLRGGNVATCAGLIDGTVTCWGAVWDRVLLQPAAVGF